MKEGPGISEQGEGVTSRFIHALAVHRELSPKTLKEYASDLKHFIAWCETVDGPGEAIHIERIATSTLVRYREAMQMDMELKPATVNRRLVTLKRFFDWAAAEGTIGEDPSKSVKLVPEPRTSPRQMTDQEESALLAATRRLGSLRDQTIVCVMLHTGLRPMEICDLLPGDIRISDVGSCLTVRSGLRNKSREVPLNAVCQAALTDYLAKRPAEASYLFASEKTGARLTERALRHLIQKYMKAARLEGLRAHDLRHRFGYVMAANIALHRLSQMMGHDHVHTTMIYSKTTRGELQAETVETTG
ncbi:tyrosine-type recombinase/integrase [Paenibacillus athensensis]|uniref:Integrase n=1 Tax=Paenibacillus athensensis TaxID=1967502 RepID=A0A4Y8PXU0_9BACL|nr:tyrosine-type recombinase/integrase [Paenibacillus athensensis]MCD1261464.1 tyrosine-type recombinase/integrase [Paenibacillus athensensis]